jgi:phosphopantothenoylcysteine decarboxylase/phosphopantothenate--cysteine ligase
MNRLQGKRLVLGVTGSIAAYKAVSLLRTLKAQGAEVSVVMTKSATKFVTPLTFSVLSGRAVCTELWPDDHTLAHLALTDRADAVVIAPATANCLAKSAVGMADDLLSTVLLGAQCPVLMVPAMDGGMWEHPAVQTNVQTLRSRGVLVLSPDTGPLASGQVGVGRFPDEGAILAALTSSFSIQTTWSDRCVLISAGPTQEPIDPVRFLSNRSSGKMGYALAEAARDRGAKVVLVTGPTALPFPSGLDVIQVETAEEMHHAVLARLSWATVVIMAAAVADFRPAVSEQRKIKKAGKASMMVELVPTPDILEAVAQQRSTQVVVGFAAETDGLLEQAQDKLRRKQLDLILANAVGVPGTGFGADDNAGILVAADGSITELPVMSKREMAERILDGVEKVRPRSAWVV